MYLRSYEKEMLGIWGRLYRALYLAECDCDSKDQDLDMLTVAKRVISRLSNKCAALQKAEAKNAELEAKLRQSTDKIDDVCDDSVELPGGLKINFAQRFKTSEKLIKQYSDAIMVLQGQLELSLKSAAKNDRTRRDLQQKLKRQQDLLSTEKEKYNEQAFLVEELQARLDELERDDSDSEEEDDRLVELISTVEGGRYTTDFRTKALMVSLQHKIPGLRFKELLTDVLALMTGKTPAEIENLVRLPSGATTYRDMIPFQHLNTENPVNRVSKQPVYGLSMDGGDAGGGTKLPILVSAATVDFSSSTNEGVEEAAASGLPSLNILTIAEQFDKDAKKSALLVRKSLEEKKLTILRLLAVAADSTAVNPASVQELQKLKIAAIKEGLENGELLSCSDRSFSDIKDHYFAFQSEPEIWLPTKIYFFPDITHCLKNAELKMYSEASKHLRVNNLNLEPALTVKDSIENYLKHIREALISQHAPEMVAAAAPAIAEASGPEAKVVDEETHDVEVPKVVEKTEAFLSSGIMTFGRLVGNNSVLVRGRMQLIVDEGTPEGERRRRIPKIPGDVGHRFNIKTDIAMIIFNFYPSLRQTLEELSEKFSGSTQAWVGGTRGTLLGHVKDALKYIVHPSFRLLVGCVAAFKTAADEAYKRFNRDDGFLINVTARYVQELMEEYEVITGCLLTPTQSLFKEFVAPAWPDYAKMFGVEYSSDAEGVDWFLNNCRNISFKDDNLVFPEDFPEHCELALRCFKADLKNFSESTKEFR